MIELRFRCRIVECEQLLFGFMSTVGEDSSEFSLFLVRNHKWADTGFCTMESMAGGKQR